MGEWVYKSTSVGSIDKGYMVKNAKTIDAVAKGNGLLIAPDQSTFGLFVVDVLTDFQLTGSTAQSRKKRDFYAHNFVQPILTVQGQSQDSYSYQKLAEFVRSTHRAATSNSPNVLTTLSIFGGGWSAQRNHKGVHQPIVVQGYIQDISRGAKRFDFHPDWEFKFVIARALSWIVTDETVQARSLKSWMDLIKKGHPNSLAERANTSYEVDPDNPLQPGVATTINSVINAIKSLGNIFGGD